MISINLTKELVDKENELREVQQKIKDLKKYELYLVNEIMAIEDDLGLRTFEHKKNRI